MTPSRRAFTLIELLVVIAIIALLIGILLPVLGNARDTARAVKASVAARSLVQASVLYADDHAGFIMPAVLNTANATRIRDERGEVLGPLDGQRYPYRLAPYFDFGWAGTTHVGERAQHLREFSETTTQDGQASWRYIVSVFPSFGVNRRYVGGDYRRTDWLSRGDHVAAISQAFDPSGLIAFGSSRFYQAANPVFPETRVEGHHTIDAPPLDSVYNAEVETRSPIDAFGYVHPRYQNKAVVGWLDGHASAIGFEGILDRRNWSDTARRQGDARWEP